MAKEDTVHNHQASRTALKVAMNIITLGAKQGMDKVLPPGTVAATEKLLIASGATERCAVSWARSPIMVCVYEGFDWMLPGQFEAFGHRKAFCELTVRRAIDSGADQVMVLGAGYDTMGWRLAPEYPRVRFFEIDHPATGGLKAKGIERMGQRENLYLIAEDLGKRKLGDLLNTTEHWRTSARTVIIAEGLLMYLTSVAVNDLFAQCAEMTGPDSLIAFSFIPSGSDGRPDVGRWSGWMRWLQEIVGEPWIWSIRPEDLPQFLKRFGWAYAANEIEKNQTSGVEYFALAVK